MRSYSACRQHWFPNCFISVRQNEVSEDPRLPGQREFTPRQLFWIFFGQSWCTKYSPEELRDLLLTDYHPPARFRVNGPLINYGEFAGDFSCPLGSNMNPKDKCAVW